MLTDVCQGSPGLTDCVAVNSFIYLTLEAWWATGNCVLLPVMRVHPLPLCRGGRVLLLPSSSSRARIRSASAGPTASRSDYSAGTPPGFPWLWMEYADCPPPSCPRSRLLTSSRFFTRPGGRILSCFSVPPCTPEEVGLTGSKATGLSFLLFLENSAHCYPAGCCFRSARGQREARAFVSDSRLPSEAQGVSMWKPNGLTTKCPSWSPRSASSSAGASVRERPSLC